MLHFSYLTPGSRIDLPEVAAHIGGKDSKFEVTEIHPGGMGVVFRLKRLSNLRTYALKCIHPDLIGDENSLNRFHDELDVWLSASVCDAIAEAITIVRINEIPSILATWMDGGDLTHLLPTLGPVQKFETIVRVLRALQWAKKTLGIIHRDLKPSNILFDNDSIAYLSDWGLARPIRNALSTISREGEPAGMERPDRTQLGSFLGTVTYAAPEQIMNTATVDHRSDIYALGCIMFELETGAPPFTGSGFQDIAYKHLHVSPPRLGGIFRKTKLGLEQVIDRCLAKVPEERYATHEELEHDLLAVATRRGFAIERYVISERYERNQLGKGHLTRNQVIENAAITSKDVVILQFEEIAPYLEEADNLITLGRYEEAEILLRPQYLPNVMEGSTAWHFGHSCAEIYAFCLQNIGGRLDEALSIYSSLNSIQEKPAEFYINYSLALLRAGKPPDARTVCRQGLALFPDDLDMLGNYTIALRECGEIEEAQTVSMRRLSLRRDVHSIEEAVAVLGDQRDHLRDRELPEAIGIAETQYNLIKEGLGLNPRYPSLRIAEIQFLRFAHVGDKALDACEAITHDERIPLEYRQIAFSMMVEALGEGEHYKTAIEMIDDHINNISYPAAHKNVVFTKWQIYADKFMIGKYNQEGQRVLLKEVIDYFLATEEEEYPYPVMAARILEWLGYIDEAEKLLQETIDNSKDLWNARKELAFVLQRAGRLAEAIEVAYRLVEIAPWRAESYDTLSYVAGKAGNEKLSVEAKKKGDLVFDKEVKLFDKLRSIIP